MEGSYEQSESVTQILNRSTYQIVILKEVREALDLRPGQEVAVLRYRGRIELIPMRPIKEMHGLSRGVDSTIERELDRELRGAS